jgi:hypothetical protein
LIAPGQNGEIAESTNFADLADAVARVLADDAGAARTRSWWSKHHADFTASAAATAVESLWDSGS